jgi:hypothetical protein
LDKNWPTVEPYRALLDFGFTMRIYVFVSENDPDLLGFTSDQTGANLPAEHGSWREEVEPGVVVIDIDDDPIAQVVRRYGFCISTG